MAKKSKRQRKSFGAFIVNWNRSGALDNCLQSIFSQTRRPDEVMVLDNASTDDSAGLLGKKYSKKVKIIACPVNLGLCKAANICFNTLDTDYVAVIENDVTLTPNWVEDVEKKLGSDREAVLVAPLFLHRRGSYWADIELRPVKGDELPVCGGVFGVRKSFFKKHGMLLYDDDFFFHAQNFELAARVLAKNGKICRLDSSASFHHIGGARAPGAFAKRIIMRNNMWNLWMHYSKRVVAVYTPIQLLYYVLFVKNPLVYASALFEALLGIPNCLKKREVVENPVFPEFVSITKYYSFLKMLRKSNFQGEDDCLRCCKHPKDFLKNYEKGFKNV